MTFVSVWKQDFRHCERVPAEVAQLLYEQGIIQPAMKPTNKGKLKPVWVSLDVLSQIRDRACRMGPRITEGNAMGKPDCVALVAEWYGTPFTLAIVSDPNFGLAVPE